MAFPQVQDADTKSGAETANTSHTLTYPTNLANGDLVLAFMSLDGNSGGTSWPAAFTELEDIANANGLGFVIAHLTSDGTETGNFTVTSGNSQKSRWRIFRVTDWHGTTAPEKATTFDAAADTNPDPPSLSPSWGAEDTLWFAVGTANQGDGTTLPIDWTAFPASYTNTFEQQGDGSGGSVDLAGGRRENNTATEDPGTFTIDESVRWVASTIAIRPAAGLTPATIAHVHEGSDDENIVIDVTGADTSADEHELHRSDTASFTPGAGTLIQDAISAAEAAFQLVDNATNSTSAPSCDPTTTQHFYKLVTKKTAETDVESNEEAVSLYPCRPGQASVVSSTSTSVLAEFPDNTSGNHPHHALIREQGESIWQKPGDVAAGGTQRNFTGLTTGTTYEIAFQAFIQSTSPLRESGVPAVLTATPSNILNADPGSYVVTGAAADTVVIRILNADPGTYTLTGIAADTREIVTVGFRGLKQKVLY